MTDIATSIGKSISGASQSISNGAQAVVSSSNNAMSGILAIIKSPKFLGAVGAVTVIALGATWILSGDNDDIVEPVIQQPGAAMPSAITEDVVDTLTPAPAVPDTAPLFIDVLQSARDAREAGNLVSPAGDNAMELYVSARSAAPDDESVAAELDALTEEVFGVAENALLANRTTEAARALRVIGLAAAVGPASRPRPPV